MPYILMRRTDIPNGVLQVDELKPNDSQRNYVLEPPGQSGYVRNIPANDTVITSGVDPIVTIRDFCGLAAYLIDNVDTGAGALTAAQANDAAAAIIGRVHAGQSVTLADVDAELAGGLEDPDSTGSLAELLSLLMGAKYQLPAGSVVEEGGAFNTTRQGFFAETPGVKTLLRTGAFNVSNGAGDLFNYKKPGFYYNGATGPAILVLADDGTVL